jgi:hypothetical protein
MSGIWRHPSWISPVRRAALGDTDAMGFYEDQIVPRLTDLTMGRRELRPIRARVAASLDGEVLEVGFGSGLNVPHYPPAVTRVQAVDPAKLGRKLAAKRVVASPVPVQYADLDGQPCRWNPAASTTSSQPGCSAASPTSIAP